MGLETGGAGENRTPVSTSSSELESERRRAASCRAVVGAPSLHPERCQGPGHSVVVARGGMGEGLEAAKGADDAFNAHDVEARLAANRDDTGLGGLFHDDLNPTCRSMPLPKRRAGGDFAPPLFSKPVPSPWSIPLYGRPRNDRRIRSRRRLAVCPSV